MTAIRLTLVFAWFMPVSVWAQTTPPFPGAHWPEASPAAMGCEELLLKRVAEYLGGSGCIVRHGHLVYQWGDASRRADIASAAKPWYTTLMLRAVQEGLLESPEVPVVRYVSDLHALNAPLGFKDREITFAHMANQTSCYGVTERPGTAFDYNDWQMALLVDTLLLKVYKSSWERVDEEVLHARLTDMLQCEDAPTLLAFGLADRPGRLAVSPRDFARFGWLMLQEGNWKGRSWLAADAVKRATTSPLDNSIPRTRATAADMLPGQRTLGSRNLPDDQTDHLGSYSWAWWTNGVDRNGNRLWPGAPVDVYAALGHKNGQRGMAVLPALDMVMAWNDTTLGERPSDPHPLNSALSWLVAAVATDSHSTGKDAPKTPRDEP